MAPKRFTINQNKTQRMTPFLHLAANTSPKRSGTAGRNGYVGVDS